MPLALSYLYLLTDLLLLMLYSLQKLAFLLSLEIIFFLYWSSPFYHSSENSLFSILCNLEMHYFLHGLFLFLPLFLPVLHIHKTPSLRFLLHFPVFLYAAVCSYHFHSLLYNRNIRELSLYHLQRSVSPEQILL